MDHMRGLVRIAGFAAAALILASGAATVMCFPWNTDPRGDESSSSAARAYYQQAYSSGVTSTAKNPSASVAPLSAEAQYYFDIARRSALESGIPKLVDEFVAMASLKDKKVLEVGAGSGLLQDAVADYTGLDISPTAQRFFHKTFVEASATDMPFPDNTFDGMWSIWVLEHIPNPERALVEMRRTLKPGGYLLLYPALDVSRYVSQGYEVRPYRDLDWKGRWIKATIPVAHSKAFHYLQYHQVRLLRALGVNLAGGPSRLHFIRLTPNYEQYWMPDSDATTSVSLQELYLWFTSRGDRCLNCPASTVMALRDPPLDGLILQVRKQ